MNLKCQKLLPQPGYLLHRLRLTSDESTRQSMTLRQKFTIADRFHRAAGYRTSRKHITGILLLVLALTSFQAPVWSRVQPAWVARYNDSLSRGTNEVIAMQFDPEGNVQDRT